MVKRFKWFGVALALLLVTTGAFLMFKGQQGTADDQNQPEVETTALAPRKLSLSGKVEAVKTQGVKLPEGEIKQVLVEDQQLVAQGQALLTVYSQEQADATTKLGSEIAGLRDQVTQMQKMKAEASEIKAIQRQLTETEQAYKQAQEKINVTVTAPLRGIVALDQSDPSDPKLMIMSQEKQARTKVSEYDYQTAKSNRSVEVTALASGKKEMSQLNAPANYPIDPKASPAQYSVTTPLTDDFLLGETLKLKVVIPGYKVPKTAVTKHNQVYVVKNDQHEAVSVKVQADPSDKQFVIIEGTSLSAKAQILTDASEA